MRRLGWLLFAAALLAALSLAFLPRAEGAPRDAGCVLICPPPTSSTTTTSTTVPSPTTSVPGSTTTTTAPGPATTTTTTAPGNAPLQADFLPCAPSRLSGGCTVDPTQVEVVVPDGSTMDAVQMSWVADRSRPAGAPAPAAGTQPVQLSLTHAVACPKSAPQPKSGTAVCWNWPSALTYSRKGGSWVLNGTYQVAACSASRCAASSDPAPARMGIAVAPKPPKAVHASSSQGLVRISWTPAVQPEPDLFGYAVTRNGQEIYACTTAGAGAGGEQACSTGLTTQDQPATGTWTYSVASLRYGVDGALGDIVPSAASAAPTSTVFYQLPSNATPTTDSFSGAIDVPGLTPAPVTSAGGSTGGATAARAPELGGAPLAGPSGGNLPYADNPALSGPATLGIREDGSPKPNPVPLGMAALGLIALALAVHVLYVRGQMAVDRAQPHTDHPKKERRSLLTGIRDSDAAAWTVAGDLGPTEPLA